MKHPPFKLFGIFGFPAAHSLSPAMQEAAFAKRKIKAYYLILDFRPGPFKKAMRGLKKPGFLLEGFNLTVPYKEAVLKYLDQVTPEARSIGAVNTVLQRGGKWIGTNTDAHGILASLEKEAGFRPRGKTILILGSGGASRAAIYGLAGARAKKIMIANRHPGRARGLAGEFRKKFPGTFFGAYPLKEKMLESGLAEADLIVNATSLGLKAGDPCPLSPALVKRALGKRKVLFFDMIYDPAPTPFLEMARRQGHKILGGPGMLLFQGAAAFECWTGKKAPVAEMRAALHKALDERRAGVKKL